MDSHRVVSSLLEVDPGFEQLCKTLFGDIVDPEDIWTFMYAPDGISKMAPVAKMNPDGTDLAVRGSGRLMRVLRTHGPTAGVSIGSGVIANQVPQQTIQRKKKNVAKADDLDVVWEGTFSKMDDEKRNAFGWASVVQVDGKPVIDRQGDFITPDDIEKAAYTYVLTNRKGGNQHQRDEHDQPLHASDLIESFVVTPEKVEKMGLPENFPLGWWVGYHFTDEDAWQDVKKGRKTGFSVHGRGKRRDMD